MAILTEGTDVTLRRTLRRRAEDKISSDMNVAFPGVIPFAETQKLLHELQVHQVELVLQNDELGLALAHMRELTERLHNILKYTPAGYFCIDPDGRFIEVNDAWLRIFGYSSPEEIIGRHFSIIQVESTSGVPVDYLAQLLNGEAIPSGEFTSRRKDGTVGYQTFSAHPVVHEEKVVRLEWFIIDISAHIRLEEEKLILQEQCQQSQKLESLGVLAGGIAHDFNNILQIIKGNCYLIRANFETAENSVPLIESSVERAAVLCRQMLTYAGKSIVNPTQVIMWMLVDDVIHTLKTTITQNVVIKTSYSADIPSVLADAGQLRQMVMNLITNAAEAIGKEKGNIKVALSTISIQYDTLVTDYFGESIPPGRYLCLEVTDTGCGMDKETKRRIFEPFYTTTFTGRGLGMSAVLGILKAHKAVFQLLSQPGKGSTIKISLPLQTDEPAADKSVKQPPAPLPLLGSGTILLVEDEEQIRDIVKIMLEMFGFTVVEAVNGREGLKQYGEYGANIILVITDIGMPVMDGYEMLHELKKINPGLPIIISSGFGDEEVKSRIDFSEIAGFISKPYSPVQFREVLKSAIEKTL